MINSTCTQKGKTNFPSFEGEFVYMHKNLSKEKLPLTLSRWQDTVDQMLSSIPSYKEYYLTIDQRKIIPGESHRRGGLHVDGVWTGTTHRGSGGHTGVWKGRWNCGTEQLIVLSSDVVGCLGVLGNYEQTEWKGGDYTHLNKEEFDSFLLEPNQVYVGDSNTFLHESIPMKEVQYRTLVRLNVNLQ